MGCSESNSDISDELIKIEKGFNALIKSVKNEMESYQKEIVKFKLEKNKIDNINFEYDQKILRIFHNKDSYLYNYYRDELLKDNYLNNAQSCLKNSYVTSRLKDNVIIELKEIEKEKHDKIESAKILNEGNSDKLKDLKKKIELCKNQIKTYEKEKQAAIIAKREEIRNDLINKNMKNGVLSLYKERQGYNQIVNEEIINRIHNDYKS